MTGRRLATLALLACFLAITATPIGLVRPVTAAEYTLETSAAYNVRPDEGKIGVTVQITFTNTTPDPAGQFSVFDQVKLAVHDEADGVTATDDDGDLDVTVAVDDDGVNVATVDLRDDLRFEESVDLELHYTLWDGDDPQLRIRPSVIVFPAWSFGTESQVSVAIPSGYDIRIDGDELTEADGRLVSGPIENPATWLALVTATRPVDYTTFDATVPLGGGTADLQVRAFSDDGAWGERILALVERALPLLEEDIGLPYPRVGELVLIESVASNASGFAETATTGTEILVAFDQPDFTAMHQVAHVWLSPALVESRWIREGLASATAEHVASGLDVEPPYDPAEEAVERADAAFQLDSWAATADPAAEGYGHAAAWAFIDELSNAVGADAIRTVLVRVASSIGPYAETEVDAAPPADAGPPEAPLTSRTFLDHLEAVSGMDLAELFSERVLTDADVALLAARTEARAAFDDLVARADGWGVPDPIRGAMTEWRFDEAEAQIAEAIAWLGSRDELLVEMEAAGLSAPDRLQQAYRSFGGGAEALAELDAQRGVVEAYAATAADLNGARTFLERVGLIGGPEPSEQLRLANGRFADGDLRGAVEAISEAQRILASAEGGGLVRLISAALVVLILVALAIVLFRRRAAYTAAP
ncbi:MAG TPA: hypothetical protein VEW95_07610 [Candidatus Limnocylindrales bacterium]|nr:hypothetical protein [Candidatus Limnocylindrales bacterium]